MESLLAKDYALVLHREQDALDILSSGLPGCIFTPEDLHPEFFDLENGLAGAAFQKFVNYNFPIAIVLPMDHAYGPRVTELVRDHRRHPCIRFFHALDDAMGWLSG